MDDIFEENLPDIILDDDDDVAATNLDDDFDTPDTPIPTTDIDGVLDQGRSMVTNSRVDEFYDTHNIYNKPISPSYEKKFGNRDCLFYDTDTGLVRLTDQRNPNRFLTLRSIELSVRKIKR